MHEGPGASGLVAAHCDPTGPLPSWERQALWVPLASQGNEHC